MTGALAYLTGRSLVNRLKRQAARIRSPRYALALLLGLAWLAVVLRQRSPSGSGGQPTAWLELGAALGVLLLVSWAWLGPSDARALGFSPAEVTLLFPAPITRRGLIHYKLLRTQLTVLVNVAIWTALAGRDHGGVSIWLRAASFWVLITTLTLHRLGAARARSSVMEHGRFGLRHRIVSVALVTAGLAALGFGLWAAWPDLVAAAQSGGSALREALARTAARPAIAVLLWPLRALVRPLGAGSPAEWRAAMVPALAVLALHYVWVLRSDTAFEEAAAEASLARARRQAARGTGGALVDRTGQALSPPLFPLAPTGWPAVALLWKNLAAVLRRRRARNLALALLVAGGIMAVASADPESTLAEVTGSIALVWLGFVVLLGPQWVRNDLRSDLLHADLLRSYPVPGWAIVAMEATASAITLTLLQLALGVLAYLAFLRDPMPDLPLTDRTLLLGGAVGLLPPINFMAMLLQNGAAVLFPGWVRVGASPTGVEALGQQLLSTTALWVLLAVILAAPAGIGVIIYRVLAGSGGGWALAPALVAGLAVVGGEAVGLVRWLGRAFERG